MKFLKKHFTKFIMSFTLAFTCLFVAFGCNTYAYTFDSNGNLVGDNLFSLNDETTNFIFDNGSITLKNSTSGVSWVTDYIDFDLSQNIYTISFSRVMGFNYYLYDENKSNELMISGNNGTNTFNLQYNAKYIRILSTEISNTPTTFQVMLNFGTSVQSWEPYGTWYSQDNYEQLQDNYSDLQGQYINLKNRYNYGFFANLSNFRMVASNNGVQVIDDSYNLQDLINTNYFSNGTFLLDNFIISNNNITYTNASIKFDFSPYLLASNVDLIFVGSYAFNFPFTITLANNQSITFNITNEDNTINHNILNDFSVSNGNSPISNFKILFDYNQFIPNIVFNSDYSNAYNTGFSDGQNASYTTINVLDKQINDLNSQVVNLSNTINTLQIAYNDLNQSYQNMLNGNNFANLFFTIAETPFASFKQIWNVDFLGVNLAGFVTGILFLGLIIWVIKKIF